MAVSCHLLFSALHCKSWKQKKPESEEDARYSLEDSTYLDALVSVQPLKFPNTEWVENKGNTHLKRRKECHINSSDAH